MWKSQQCPSLVTVNPHAANFGYRAAVRLCQSQTMVIAFAFVLGLVVGSFLNVCILRIPAGESIVRPASHCPKCQKPIAPYDNVPLLS